MADFANREPHLFKKLNINCVRDEYFRLNKLLKEYNNYIFLSPHLDDAVFSCGDLIALLQKHHKRTTVITVFTQASELPFTGQAYHFLQTSGYKNAQKLFTDRMNEDISAMKYLGCKYVHLDFIDAAWRKSKRYYTSSFMKIFLKNLPLLSHIYPTNKKQFSGKIDNEDESLIEILTKKLQSFFKKVDKILLFAPLGIGGHVDHVIIQDVARKLNTPTLFWEDFPYNTHPHLIENFFSRQGQFDLYFELNKELKSKKYEAIRKYKSQVPALFPSGKIPKISEKYYSLSDSSI